MTEGPITVPQGWQVLLTDQPGVDLVAVEPPGDPDAFRANLIVTRVSVGGLEFGDWQKGTESLNARELTDYLVIDLERLEVAGRPGGRRLAHHVSARNEALTMEQWFVVVADMGHTLTLTVDSLRYDGVADLAAEVARTFSPTEGNPRAV